MSAPPSEALYHRFTSLLRLSRDADTPLQIELIPPELSLQTTDKLYSPFLYENTHLGMTKQTLMQLFLYAREEFFNSESPEIRNLREDISAVQPNMKSLEVSRQTNLNEQTMENIERIFNASFVMILWDPEYLTAINIRRKTLVWLEQQPQAKPQESHGKGINQQTSTVEIAKKEMLMLDGLLTSFLNKHVKSSLLWGYRRWLIFRYGFPIIPHQPPGHPAFSTTGTRETWSSLTLLDKELAIVRKASEIHPTNYYAWTHARLITTHLLSPSLTISQAPFITPIPTLFRSLLTESHLPYCILHSSDTSTWSFHIWLTTCFFLHPLSRRIKYNILQQTLSQIIDIFAFLEQFSSPGDHESIWVFLRTIIARMVDVETNLGLEPDRGNTDCEPAIQEGEASKAKLKQILEILQRWVDEEDRHKETGKARKAQEWVKKRITTA